MSGSRVSPLWHPFTQHALEGEMIEIASAEGAWLTTATGKRLFDAISSWWVITHAHRHPAIVAAIAEQADTLDQVIFAGFTHAPAERVARELINATPEGLEHVFLSDSGSTSVEVALKMALGYWHNLGMRRPRILALEHAYHGDTIGTMSAGARGVFNSAYAPLLFEVGRIPFPQPGGERTTLDALEQECRAGDVAAFIVEPLILGAGGMLMYGPDVLAQMRAICQSHGVLFIADEVMTGFGRTGTMFACDLAGIAPDILCLAKGLTGGSVPLAATLCTGPIFEAHYAKDRAKTFFHSSSYTANPICCAAAAANLALWRTEPVQERVTNLVELQTANLAAFGDDARFVNVRQTGTIVAMDVAGPGAGYLAQIALPLRAAAVRRGVLLRPLGETIYVMPPYCTTPAELATVYATIRDCVAEVLA